MTKETSLFGSIVILVLAISAFLQFSAPVQIGTQNQTGQSQTNPDFSARPYNPVPVILHSVQNAKQLIGDSFLVPDPTLLGLGYRIAGVVITASPHFITNEVGVTTRDWDIGFIISDKPVVNGTTAQNLIGHVVIIRESYVGKFDSYSAALDLLSQGQICTGSALGVTQTCTPQNSLAKVAQLVQIRNTWLVVDQSAPWAEIYLGSPTYRTIGISGNLSYQSMMTMVNSLIP